MASVLLRTYKTSEAPAAVRADLGRVPIIGEYLAFGADSDWYKVEMIVHTPGSEAEAVVWAVLDEHAADRWRSISSEGKKPAKVTFHKTNPFYS